MPIAKRQLLTFMTKTSRLLFAGMLLLLSYNCNAQSASRYLFHFDPFKQVQPESPMQGRKVKVRIDFGLLQQFYVTDPNYTTGENTTGDGTPYTLGLKLEIPIMKNSDIITGIDYMNEGFNFDSYFFAKGYSFLYNDSLVYNHDISLDEIQIPILYKMNFSNEERNVKTFYATLGWAFRYLLFNNATVTSTEDTKHPFVWEGQNDIVSAYHLITAQGSGIIEASLGYQHNALRNGNAWYLEIEYKYGVSPFIYNGNGMGSNNVQFSLNTLAFKFGLRL